MKNALFILCIVLLCISCNKNAKTEDKESAISVVEDKQAPLEGTWEMIGYYNYDNNKITDSFKTKEGHRQVKMYTKNKVMWSKLVPHDSTEWFGYGSYTLNDSILTEVLDYGSKLMNEVIAEQKEFVYQLKLEDDKFSQIELDEDGNLVYSENYVRIE